MGIGALLTNVASDWLLELIPDRRRRSAEIFQPIHVQFVAALADVHAGGPATHLDTQFWRGLKSAEQVKLIKVALREQLEDIYENFGPRYDSAWHEMNDEGLRTLMAHLGDRYGYRREYHPSAKYPQWRRFLCEDKFSPSLLELSRQEDIQLWDRYFLYLSRVELPDQAVNGFLRICWTEAARTPVFAKVKAERTVLKREIWSALRHVTKHVAQRAR
jgi:hypothetical protein